MFIEVIRVYNMPTMQMTSAYNMPTLQMTSAYNMIYVTIISCALHHPCTLPRAYGLLMLKTHYLHVFTVIR